MFLFQVCNFFQELFYVEYFDNCVKSILNMCLYVYMHMDICVYICIYMNIYMYVYILIYIDNMI